jgi:Caleosin related protein
MQIRLRDCHTGTYCVVDTNERKVYGDGLAPDLVERALASASDYMGYFVRPVPGTATPDGKFLVRGGLNQGEVAALAAGRQVRPERTALELHLDFFDLDGDGTITLAENYRGWRALGFSRFAAALKAFFAALFFGFRIDIDLIARRRSSGIFRKDGGIDQDRLAAFIAEFDAGGGGELGFEQVRAALKKHSTGGIVSRGQFSSLFAVCKRMNGGRSVITKAQFVGLFDGSLLWLAASMTDNAGRRARWLQSASSPA